MTHTSDFIPSISASVADWERERPTSFYDPPRRLLRSIRQFQRLQDKHGPIAWLRRHLTIASHHLWSVITATDIPVNCKIEGGLILAHPTGVVIHPDATLGVNCWIASCVTIGNGPSGAPKIGGHVDIGTGAKILGGITIGDHAKIGANAVVITDVPEGSTAVGVPAKMLPADSA
ncbi:Serine acetyltransferase [Planctomycetes bacterium CA13]|uniref:Serine acetyltransferase n=1 Tax=Novipirellula herctigrandis TaxID=2527986 RepID=A0A5C5Z528_9BACT|nr:Serine acetyltransferase [Planctomycetes bacterium CA13]